jgi:hypothetical protein
VSKQFQHSYPLPADVPTAFAAIASEGWAAAKAEHLRDGSTVKRFEQTADGGTVLQITRDLPDGVPGFLERFLPADGKAGQTDTWAPDAGDGTRRGTWKADIPGAPAEVSGTMRLEPDGAGSRYVVEGTVKVRIPVVGGRAESFIADMTGKLTAKEAEVLRGLLA